MEGVISWEDANTNEIDVIARTLLRISRVVAKSVDDDIWDVLTESRSVSKINQVSITAGNEWDSTITSNQNPVKDILHAIRLIEEYNYSPTHLVLSPKDFQNLASNASVRNAGQFIFSLLGPIFKVNPPHNRGAPGSKCGFHPDQPARVITGFSDPPCRRSTRPASKE